MNKEHYNEYMRGYMLKRYHRRRGEAILQLGGHCVDCGSIEELEFDHAHSEDKTFDLGRAFTSMSEERLQHELTKCVLRCFDCHKAKTIAEDSRTVPHGGGIAGKKNCPCYLCKPLKQAYQKANSHKWKKSK